MNGGRLNRLEWIAIQDVGGPALGNALDAHEIVPGVLAPPNALPSTGTRKLVAIRQSEMKGGGAFGSTESLSLLY